MRSSLTGPSAILLALCGLTASFPAPATSPHTAEPIERDSYVLIPADKNSSTMSGTLDNYRRAKALRVGREGLLYVRRGGVGYVIRDRATLAEAAEIFRPQQLLGAQQADLGASQAALGARQAALGAQQGRLGRRQANVAPRVAIELSRQQDALSYRQAVLSAQQEVLGKQQEGLGREQERQSRAATETLARLLDAAMRRGLAQRIG